jgi:hypothetical protein
MLRVLTVHEPARPTHELDEDGVEAFAQLVRGRRTAVVVAVPRQLAFLKEYERIGELARVSVGAGQAWTRYARFRRRCCRSSLVRQYLHEHSWNGDDGWRRTGIHVVETRTEHRVRDPVAFHPTAEAHVLGKVEVDEVQPSARRIARCETLH